MAKCIECGKKGDWKAICPDCFAKSMIEADDEPRCTICGAPYQNQSGLGLAPCINGHTFQDELKSILKR